jgi:hypothetical protein
MDGCQVGTLLDRPIDEHRRLVDPGINTSDRSVARDATRCHPVEIADIGPHGQGRAANAFDLTAATLQRLAVARR